jgi:23S rRNA (uracil1939-C5)-methyltransferase
MGKIVELDLKGIAHGGEAFGWHEGKITFVAYAIPGERVRAEIVQEKKNWARARLLEVLEPSSDRVEPRCSHFGQGRCGGCQWQHISYHRQLALKREIVEEQLRRIGHLEKPPVEPVVSVAEPWHYRNNARFAVASDGSTGFKKAQSHEVIRLQECHLLHPKVFELYQSLELSWPRLQGVKIRHGVNTDEDMVVIETGGEEQPEISVDIPISIVLETRRNFVPLIGLPYIYEEVAGIRYRISAGSFFQSNTAGAETLVSLVKEFLDPQPGQTVLDGYSGVGLFGLTLAHLAGSVIAIEENPWAMEDLAQTAEDIGLDNISLFEGPMGEVVRAIDQRVDAAVVDPPRSGMEKNVPADLAHLGVRRLVYVSCDPATMARDASSLRSVGFELKKVQPVDMFPQTFHIESVSLWERRP